MATEEWVDVEGYEGVYQVSSRGRVRSFCGWKWGMRREEPRILKPGPDGRYGLTAVNLAGPNGLKRGKVHQLVAAAFIGPCPPGQDVRHLDGDAANNSVANLAYGTRYENIHDALRHGTIRRGEGKSQAKLTEAKVRRIRAAYAAGAHTHRELAKQYGITHATIQDVIARRSWAHVA